MHAAIDADGIVWRCLSAAGHTIYVVEHEGKTYKWRLKSDVDKAIAEWGLTQDSILKEYNSEPISHAMSTIKRCLEKILVATSADSYTVYIGGTGNYRKDWVKRIAYKGTRKGRQQPEHFDDAMAYLKNNWDAVVVDNAEGDDAVSIDGFSDPEGTVMVSSDKDLDNTPGWHYNWVTDQLYHLSNEEATYNFYMQMLAGDKADNVPGIYGIGKVLAAKLFADCETEKDLYNVVKEQYQKVHGDEWEEWLHETAMLLWIQREPGVLWSPPDA